MGRNPRIDRDLARLRDLNATVDAVVRDALCVLMRIVEDEDLPAQARIAAMLHLKRVIAQGRAPEDIAARVEALVQAAEARLRSA